MYRAKHAVGRRPFGRMALLLALTMVVAAFAVGPFAGAGSWEERVNGHATYAALPGLSVSVSAWTQADGAGFGNAEYEYYNNAEVLQAKFHFQAMEVCFMEVNGFPAMKMYGEWKMQEGTSPYAKPIAGVGIIDYGTGTDTLRVPLYDDAASASAWCNSASGWGGAIGSGDYRIRAK